MDHYNSELLEVLGIKFVDDGVNGNVREIYAQNDAILSNINFNYDGGASPRFSVDELINTDSEVLYKSGGDEVVRMLVIDQADSYKAISSSLVFGALCDGDSLSTKPYLFSEMIDFLLGYTTVTEIQEAFGQYARQEAVAFPNPVSDFTNISFDLDENSDVSLSIYDEMGKLVQLIKRSNLPAGNNIIGWNTSNLQGQAVESGIYFYKLSFNDKSASGKLIVQP